MSPVKQSLRHEVLLEMCVYLTHYQEKGPTDAPMRRAVNETAATPKPQLGSVWEAPFLKMGYMLAHCHCQVEGAASQETGIFDIYLTKYLTQTWAPTIRGAVLCQENMRGQKGTLPVMALWYVIVTNIRGWSKSTGGVGQRKWKPGSSKKHDPPPRSGTKFWWPTPDIMLKKTWPTPITQLRVLHFLSLFPFVSVV